jgi:hypothetical protein
MISLIARYGIVAGLIVVIPMLWNFWLGLGPGDTPEHSMLFGYLTMLVALTAVFIGVKRYRDKLLGGAIRFLPALGIGLGISAVASIFYVIGWEVCMAFSGFDFIEHYKTMMIESAKASHPTPAELQQAIADAESFAKNYVNPLYRMPFTFIEIFPVGVLISLISAAVLRNSRVLPARAPS